LFGYLIRHYERFDSLMPQSDFTAPLTVPLSHADQPLTGLAGKPAEKNLRDDRAGRFVVGLEQTVVRIVLRPGGVCDKDAVLVWKPDRLIHTVSDGEHDAVARDR